MIRDQLTLAHGELNRLNFGGNPARAPQKLAAMKAIVQTAGAIKAGDLSGEPLEAALKEIESLQNDGKKMGDENRNLLNGAADRIKSVLPMLKKN